MRYEVVRLKREKSTMTLEDLTRDAAAKKQAGFGPGLSSSSSAL
jgi:hypothetical protein